MVHTCTGLGLSHRLSPSASISSSIHRVTVHDRAEQGCWQHQRNCRWKVIREYLWGFKSKDLRDYKSQLSAGGQQLGLGCPQEGREQSGPRGLSLHDGRGPSHSLGGLGPPRVGGNFESSRQPAAPPPPHQDKRPISNTHEKIYIEVDVFSNGFLLCSSLFSL